MSRREQPEPMDIELVAVARDGDSGDVVGDDRRRPVDWYRAVIAGAISIAAVALVVIAVASVDTARMERRQACIFSAQTELFGPSGGNVDQARYRDRMEECGLRFDSDSDAEPD
jgi:hypothetical protein